MSAAELNAETLRQIPIFKNMNDSERRQLADIATVKEFAQGEIILRQGKSSQNMWVLLEGECEVIKEPESAQTGIKPFRLALLEVYSNFGEMSFFHPAPHSATVRALTKVRVLRIERADFEELVREGCSAAYRLGCNSLDTLAERLRRMDEWVATLLRDGKPSASAEAQVPEWSKFRDKLFTAWNL